jgi:hypothetical protein
MRYQIPQFIEIEDKIFGPLTIKQFLYVAGGAALGFIIWSILPKFLAIIIAGPVVLFFMALAFYRFNDRPFIYTVEYAIKYFFGNKLYIWHKKEKKPTNTAGTDASKNTEASQGTEPNLFVPKLSDSKLKEISWSLDIKENLR